MFQGSLSLKFFKRLNIYKNSTGTVEFNPTTLEGRSYNWTFVAKLHGVLVFNDYNWSPTTNGHQSAVRSVLRELKLPYIVVNAGAVDTYSINKNTMRAMYKDLCKKLIEVDAGTRLDSWAHKNRVSDAAEIQESLDKLEALSKDLCLSVKEKQTIMNECVEAYFADLHRAASDKCHKYLSVKRAGEQFEAIAL